MVGHEPFAGISESPTDAAMMNAAGESLPVADAERCGRAWRCEGGTVRTSAGWRRRMLWVGLLLGLAAHAAVLTAGEAPTWEPGMYWTYDATTTYMDAWGRTETGKVTLIVLGKDFVPDSGAWLLAGIRDWWSGGEMVSPVSVLGPPALYLRWPVLTNLLPKSDTMSFDSILAHHASMVPGPGSRPYHLETVARPFSEAQIVERPDWLDQELGPGETAESMTLIPGDAGELLLPSGSFPEAAPVRYSLERGGESISGTAWWLPNLLAWGSVEGHEELLVGPGYSYKVTLSEWGRLSEAEMTDRLRSALERMEPFDREEAQGWRALLASFGFDL
jgi:hypothetical protein